MRSLPPIFFFHIPKTAGSTLQHLLRQRLAASAICPADTWTSLLRLDKAKIAKYQLFQGHFYGQLESVIGQPCFSFTILRDPIERTLSHYGHVIRDPNHYLHPRAMALGSLDAYLADPIAKMTVSNFQARMLAMEEDVAAIYPKLSAEEQAAWALEQYLETTDFGLSNPALFSAARTRLKSFALVGTTERLDEVVALLCYLRAWAYPNKIENQNVNVNRLKHEEISPSTMTRIAQLNDIDIPLYKWAKQVFHVQFMRMLADLINKQTRRGRTRFFSFLPHESTD